MQQARGNDTFKYHKHVKRPTELMNNNDIEYIGKSNIFREGITVHRGTIQDKSKTVIGDGNLFMAYTHVAHDCVVGNYNVFANSAGLAGHVTLGNYVTLGAFTLVHQFCKLGDYSFTGLNTIITMDVPAFVKVAANPARPIGLNSIGMQRNNFDTESINLIKKAYFRPP